MKKLLFPFLCVLLVCSYFSCDEEKNDPDNLLPIANTISFSGKNIAILGSAELDLDGQYKEYEHLERMDVDFLLEDEGLVRISFVVEKDNTTPVAGNYVFKGSAANSTMQIFRGWYEDETGNRYDFISGDCVVTVKGDIYTFLFEFICEGQKMLSGSYEGNLLLVSDDDNETDEEGKDDEEDEEDIPVQNVVTVNGMDYPIIREAELDLDGQYKDYEHLERMDIEFVLDEDKISTVCISVIVEKGNHSPVAGNYTFEGRSANEAMQIFRGWYDDKNEERYDFKSGNCTIEIENENYTFFFEFMTEDDKEVSGSYQGPLVLISGDEDDDENEIIPTVENIITVDGVDYPITQEAELDLDGQYKDYEHLERMDIEFMFGEGKWPHVGISPIVEKGNYVPVAGYYTFEGESADNAWQMFRAWYTDEYDQRHDFVSGDCTIEVDSEIYTFFFGFTTKDGKNITGSYQGTLKNIN